MDTIPALVAPKLPAPRNVKTEHAIRLRTRDFRLSRCIASLQSAWKLCRHVAKAGQGDFLIAMRTRSAISGADSLTIMNQSNGTWPRSGMRHANREALEVNAQPDRLDLTDTAWRAANRARVGYRAIHMRHTSSSGSNMASIRHGWTKPSNVLNPQALRSRRVRRQ
jgi:hypothetical protein